MTELVIRKITRTERLEQIKKLRERAMWHEENGSRLAAQLARYAAGRLTKTLFRVVPK